MTMDDDPWTGRPCCRLRGVAMTDRVKDLINLAWIHRIKNPPEGLHELRKSERMDCLTKNFFVDYSQQNNRSPWGSLKTLTTTSSLYSFELDRHILPEECMVLQGHPMPDVTSMAATEIKDLVHLSGEGMSVPMLASAMMAMILTVPLAGLWERAPMAPRPGRV